MTEVRTIEGDLQVEGARIAIAVTRFNEFITDSLLKGTSRASAALVCPRWRAAAAYPSPSAC